MIELKQEYLENCYLKKYLSIESVNIANSPLIDTLETIVIDNVALLYNDIQLPVLLSGATLLMKKWSLQNVLVWIFDRIAVNINSKEIGHLRYGRYGQYFCCNIMQSIKSTDIQKSEIVFRKYQKQKL